MTEHCIFLVGLSLQILGGMLLVGCRLTKCRKCLYVVEIGILSCLVGLGSIAVMGALLRLTSGLIAGAAVVVMALVIIRITDGEAREPITDWTQTF